MVENMKPATPFVWEFALGPGVNADRLGNALAQAHPNLFRTSAGLIEAVPAENKVLLIESARKLAPLLIDHLDIHVLRGAKIVGEAPLTGCSMPCSLLNTSWRVLGRSTS